TGDIIITTRNVTICNSEYFHNIKCIKVGELTTQEKETLFFEITGQKPVPAFLDTISSYPLDVSTAAYYIKNTAISCNDYLERLQDIDNLEKESNRIILLCSDYKHSRYSIVSSTFDNIIRQYNEFRILALALTLTDSQNIPRFLLERISSKAIVDAFICELLKHSIVSVEGDMINLHRSTQELGRRFISKIFSPQEAEKYIRSITNGITPYSEIRWLMYKSNINNYSTKWTAYLPHYKAIIRNTEQFPVSRDCKNYTTARILIAHGFILAGSGENIKESNNLYKKALETEKDGSYIGDYEKIVILFEFGYGALLYNDYEKSFLYTKQGLDLCKKVPGSEAIQIMLTANLGRIYSFMNNNTQAACYLNKALALIPSCEKIWTKNLRSQILCQLARLYVTSSMRTEDIRQAISCSNDVLVIWDADRYFHENDMQSIPKVAFFSQVARCNLAEVYNYAGEHVKALREADEIEYFYNKDPDNTTFGVYLNALVEKGLALIRIGRTAEAERCLDRSIENFTKMGGDFCL
ncbi:MAG: hypothetical protein LBH60_03305, partial [Prevotellaceae bacterium]|nr:hypothetical protein [Prevotellaceae bacterium]